jgi:hypothetical protein
MSSQPPRLVKASLLVGSGWLPAVQAHRHRLAAHFLILLVIADIRRTGVGG